MRLVHNERNGEAFDSQLVIGVRESYVNLCSNTQDKLQVSVPGFLSKTLLLLLNYVSDFYFMYSAIGNRTIAQIYRVWFHPTTLDLRGKRKIIWM